MKKIVAVLALPVLLILIVVVEMNKDHGGPSSPDSPGLAFAKPDASTTSKPVPFGNWMYKSSVNQMTDQLMNRACLPSDNQLDFKPPYSGGGQGVLCVEKTGKKLQADVGVINGQFVCGVLGCRTTVRFDDEPARSYHMLIPSTYEANVIYFQSAQSFLNSLKRAKRVRIAADFYQDGNQVLEFSPEGLDESMLNPAN